MSQAQALIPDEQERAAVERLLKSAGISTASLIDYGRGAEYFFVVPADELARVDAQALAVELTQALPGRKAWIVEEGQPASLVPLY